MDAFKALSPVFPVFLLITIGFTFAHSKKISLAALTEIIVYLAAPCLVFTSLATKPLLAADIAIMLAGAIGTLGGGFVCGYLTATIIGAEGVNRQLILLYGSLPSAVVNFVLTEKYGQDPNLAASIVVLSTTISVASIPLVFWLIL